MALITAASDASYIWGLMRKRWKSGQWK